MCSELLLLYAGGSIRRDPRDACKQVQNANAQATNYSHVLYELNTCMHTHALKRDIHITDVRDEHIIYTDAQIQQMSVDN
jgi:hypothetical protein